MSHPRLSVILPVRHSPDDLRVCLERLQASSYKDYEVIVVDDASTDDTPDVATEMGAQIVRMERQSGPAAARNRGAEVAQGDYLFFLDADVGVHPDTLSQMVATFEQNPDVDAVFGSYDTQPQARNFISQYKNLFHHFVHQQGREEASTFWSGCGAIRRTVFLEMGGFDTSYGRPCIEDIELGARLRKAGRKIVLNKNVQVTHLKRWTLWSLIKSDVFDRAIPWTELILRERSLPSDLNLKLSQRLSAVVEGTDFISSMPITEFIKKLDPPAPANVLEAARQLKYRDFVTVCLIVNKPNLFPDNWIYVHDPAVKISRIQNFKNWSPDMVADATKTSLGLEYFCNEGDELWTMPDADLIELGKRELERIGLAQYADVEDGCVFRVAKSYPIYDADYRDCLTVIREFLDSLENFQTVGRNGLHRYNNQDHAMLTGMLAVRNLVLGEKHDLWSVNADQEYLEEMATEDGC